MTLPLKDLLNVLGGPVGLCIANQLLERRMVKNIALIEKASKLRPLRPGRKASALDTEILYKRRNVEAQAGIAGLRNFKII